MGAEKLLKHRERTFTQLAPTIPTTHLDDLESGSEFEGVLPSLEADEVAHWRPTRMGGPVHARRP
jgi:hypothetical protein